MQPKSWKRRVLCIILCRFTLHQHPTDLAVDAPFCRLSMDDTLSEKTDLSVQSITSFLRLYLYATRKSPTRSFRSWMYVLLTRHSDGTISMSVFRKPTHVDKHLDFMSHHPLAHKVSLIRTLYHCANHTAKSSFQFIPCLQCLEGIVHKEVALDIVCFHISPIHLELKAFADIYSNFGLVYLVN